MSIDKLTNQTLPLKQNNSPNVQNNQMDRLKEIKELREKSTTEIKNIYQK